MHFPVLHRPTFMKSISEGLHLRHYEFGGVVLALCAAGARYSNDPRNLMEETAHVHSSGWKWFKQVQPIPASFVAAPSIYQLQLYCVRFPLKIVISDITIVKQICIMYLHGTSTPESCGVLLGLGVRAAQDVGAHRKPPGETKRTVESEQWSRAFWCLIAVDILMSAFVGRPRATNSDE